jgi:hypothetical protein
VRAAHRPVFVASRAFQPITSVLVAYDGGSSSMKAVDHMARSPLFAGLKVTIATVGSATPVVKKGLADAEALLKAAGIAAGPVVPGTALLHDPHLAARGFWAQAERRFVGAHVLPRAPYALDGRRPAVSLPAPTLGEHNAEVLGGVLGMGAAEVAALEADGIIGTRAI